MSTVHLVRARPKAVILASGLKASMPTDAIIFFTGSLPNVGPLRHHVLTRQALGERGLSMAVGYRSILYLDVLTGDVS